VIGTLSEIVNVLGLILERLVVVGSQLKVNIIIGELIAKFQDFCMGIG
jgi:hypothetical protein